MKIYKLQIKHKGYEIINCQFSNDFSVNQTIYKTLIIGQNASGKSFLLRQVCDVFEMIELLKEEVTKKVTKRYDFYEISYLIDDNKYTFSINKEDNIKTTKNDIEIDILELPLPNKVIANTYIFDDKFKFSQNLSDSIYYYGGIKTTSNAAFTSNSQLELLKYLTNFIATSKQVILLETLKYLEYSPKLKINLLFKNTDLNTLVEKRVEKN